MVDRVIECLPSCVGPGNPPRDEPAVYRDLALTFYNANDFQSVRIREGAVNPDTVTAAASARSRDERIAPGSRRCG